MCYLLFDILIMFRNSRNSLLMCQYLSGSELPSMDSLDQHIRATKRIDDFDKASKQTENPMDMNVEPPSEMQIQSSEEKDIDKEVAKEDPLIEVPYIDFIIGDRPLILGDCVQMEGTQELKHQFIRARINTNLVTKRSSVSSII